MIEEEMAKNFPKSTKDLKVQIQEVLKHTKKDQLTHIQTQRYMKWGKKKNANLSTSQNTCWKPQGKKNTVLKAT